MGYDTAAKTDTDSVIEEDWGGMWFLKHVLDTDYIGFTVLELEPGGKNMAHDEADSGQEEIYYVLEGLVEIDVDGEPVELRAEEAIRLDPDERRQIENVGDERASMVLVGAPLD